MTDTSVLYCVDLGEIRWPDDAIFIVDGGLPEAVVDAVPRPKLHLDGGESQKSLTRIGDLAERVLELRSERPLTLVAVGGGAVGDAVGFLASILWRGVRLWHVPTTLVAMVDSAHGGKTAVNLGGRKNQLGTFYPAHKVVIGTHILDTLPLDLREEGLVELLKVLWLERPNELAIFDDDSRYHDLLTADIEPHRIQWQELIKSAVEAKKSIVSCDPDETTGYRRILNLGHTAGHGLEAIYGIAHGRAVAWGLAAAAVLSSENAGLSDDAANRLIGHVDPLLVGLPEFFPPGDRERFIACLKRDKKRVDGRLISILLDGPGAPVQTDQLTAEDWWCAVKKAAQSWRRSELVIAPGSICDDSAIAPPVDKSRANRAAVIAHLRSEKSEIVSPPGRLPADVSDLRRALDMISSVPVDAPIAVEAGNGATTGRFLLAVAANRPGSTKLRFSKTLQQRPHHPLIEALRGGGATIEKTASGYLVEGWSAFPRELTVDASQSSQFASAPALLAAEGHSFSLHLSGPVVSQPYLDLTISMLNDCGVDIDSSDDHRLRFSPGSDLSEAWKFEIPQDASSVVVWKALQGVDKRFKAPPFPAISHPDRRFSELVDALESETTTLQVDLQSAPDLAPVLTAVACCLCAGLTVTNAAHLRHKESNRIDDLVDAFGEIGLNVTARSDGLAVPPGVQIPSKGAVFNPRGDHRLAMAGFVLAANADGLIIENARCVAKSYPDLWRQARRLGYRIYRHQRSVS